MLEKTLNRESDIKDEIGQLKEQNKELVRKYRAQCDVSEELRKENAELSRQIRCHTVMYNEMKQILEKTNKYY